MRLSKSSNLSRKHVENQTANWEVELKAVILTSGILSRRDYSLSVGKLYDESHVEFSIIKVKTFYHK